MRVLLTGATGFVGKNLKSYLKDRCHLEELSRGELNAVTLDSIKNADVIVHLAGLAHDVRNTNDPKAYERVNFELTKNLYEVFLKSNARKFIFISSVKAVADAVASVLDEDALPDPLTAYGKSKLKAEQFIQSQLLPNDKSYYILRPCMIHGPLNKGNLNLLYKFVQRGIPYPLASFVNKRSFLSITNLCFIIKELVMQLPIPSGIYNVADDEPLSTNEVVTIFAESMCTKPKLWHISKPFIYAIARIGDQLKLPVNSDRLNKLTENYVVSNQKIKNSLMVQLPVDTKEGLIITAKSFRA